MINRLLRSIVYCILFVVPVFSGFAQVNISSVTTAYTQNFNTLRANAGSSTTLPTGWKLLETGTSANTSYTTDAGSTTTGDTYSYGTGTTTDRALGTLLTSSLISTIGIQVGNTTGQTITQLIISYRGEQWRCGTAGRQDALNFQYSLNATSLNTGTWTEVTSLHFYSPNTSSTGAKDGNASGNFTDKSATINGLNIPNNAIFWLRWVDTDASGSDDGLAIDDFSLQLTAPDIIPPVISSLNPVHGATDIDITSIILIQFNENIQKGTNGTIFIKKSSNNNTAYSVNVTDASVTISGAIATIPFSGLEYSTGYYVEIPAGTFTDLAANNFAGISGPTVYNFTTKAPPPPVLTTNPVALDFGYIPTSSVSVIKSFNFSITNITEVLTLTIPAGFEISRNAVDYYSYIKFTVTEALAGQTVYVRFKPAIDNYSYSEKIRFWNSTYIINDVQLTGTTISYVPPAQGPLNFYFGNLHAHSSYSDGNADDVSKTPAHDFEFAKTALCFDFLGISEHNHATAGMQLSNWGPGRQQTFNANTPTFAALYGMEWGVISGGGHVIVYGMDSLVGWEAGNYQVYVPKNLYKGTGGLFDILNRHGGNALAYLAHPNTADFNDLQNGIFDLEADKIVVGSTVESGPAFSTNTTYTDPGSSMSYLTYYRNMLSKGYHIGPTIDHDNHNMTFGKTTKTRLVVMAQNLSENDLLDGMKKLRFYASQDCAARITYKINEENIGSIITQYGTPTISVGSVTTNPVSSVKIMAGVPGSGVTATQLTSSTSSAFTYTDISLSDLSQRYYYLDITETDGTRIITAPIWYTRNDAAFRSTTISSFFTMNEPNRVYIKWTTENEQANQVYEVQRSLDGGRTYQTIGIVNGRGPSDNVLTYGFSDNDPFEGLAFYRLLQKNSFINSISYTDIKAVNRGLAPADYFTVYPNPVRDGLSVKIMAYAPEKTMLEILDIAGRRLMSVPVILTAGEQQIRLNLSALKNGSYILKFNLGGKVVSQIINKL